VKTVSGLGDQATFGGLPDQLADRLAERQSVALGVCLRRPHRIIFQL
jgi:hypothetical protein